MTIGGDGVGYLGSLTRHVFETLAFHAQIALHVRVLSGRDPHHLVEAQFKAVARALRDAVAHRPARAGRALDEGRSVTGTDRAGPASVVVLDYGSGNLRSAVRALERAGAAVTLTADRSAAQDADGLVVPGVGAFASCVEGIRAVRGHEVIGRRLAGGRPVLGICVGMQVLFAHGVEHGVDTEGLDEWPGVVERLRAPVVPHMGWNTVEAPGGQPAVRRRREGAVLLRALLRRARLDAAHQRPHPSAAGDLGRARRRPVRRGRGERPAVRDAVPPGEVRRRRRPPAGQLGRGPGRARSA